MEKFFFNLVYPADTNQDPEGSECPSLEAAKIEARAVMREILVEAVSTDPMFEPSGILICTKAGMPLAHVTAIEAVDEIMSLNNPPSDTSRVCR